MEEKNSTGILQGDRKCREWDFQLVFLYVRLGVCLGLMFVYSRLGKIAGILRNGTVPERLALVCAAVLACAAAVLGACFLYGRYRKSLYCFYCRCPGRQLYPLLADYMGKFYPGTKILRENGTYGIYFVLHIPEGGKTGLKGLCCVPHPAARKFCIFRIRRNRHVMDECLRRMYETGADAGVVIMDGQFYRAYTAAAFFRRDRGGCLQAGRRKDAVHRMLTAMEWSGKGERNGKDYRTGK